MVTHHSPFYAYTLPAFLSQTSLSPFAPIRRRYSRRRRSRRHETWDEQLHFSGNRSILYRFAFDFSPRIPSTYIVVSVNRYASHSQAWLNTVAGIVIASAVDPFCAFANIKFQISHFWIVPEFDFVSDSSGNTDCIWNVFKIVIHFVVLLIFRSMDWCDWWCSLSLFLKLS